MRRWSPDVRSRIYAFELVGGLYFDDTVADVADLWSLSSALGAAAAGVRSGSFKLIARLERPKYDYKQTGAIPATAPGDTLENEFKDTMKMAALRNDRMAEILTQVTVPYPFFAMVLNLQPGRHRFTFEMMAAAFNFASAVGQRFKHRFRVVRPADRSSLIQPVLLTPGHSSYPAGHAAQCHLVKVILAQLLDTLATLEIKSQLEALANRISENRVVAGLHFNVDNAQGKVLGEKLAGYFIDKSKVAGSGLEWLWRRAKDEWPK